MQKLFTDSLLSLLVIIAGLYVLTFSKAFASWAVGFDGKIIRTALKENVYQTFFKILGGSFVFLGVLILFLII